MAFDERQRRSNTRELIRKLIPWSVSGIGILVVTAALGSLALHAYGAHRLEKVRAEFHARWRHLTQIAPPSAVPDHENGARWLLAGGRAIVCTVEDRRFYGQLSNRSAAGWTDRERSRAQWILHEQQNALEILLRSGTVETFDLGTDEVRASYEDLDFSSILMGLRLLMLEARLAWSEGRTSDSLAALDAVGRAADGLMQTPIVMTSTIGSAATRWTARAAADFVSDPCTDVGTLEGISAALPSEDPVHWGNITLAVSVAEIAGEGLRYIDDPHDPSMGWSIPFWISNHYLLEDLFVAEILERWSLQLELGQEPAARWSSSAAHEIWGASSWPPWLALGGTYTPNLLSVRAREQAASTELQQTKFAIGLRLASPDGLGPEACATLSGWGPTALTGEPIACLFDEERGLIVIEIPGAVETLRAHVSVESQAATFPPIEIPVGRSGPGCGQAIGPGPWTTTASR